MLYVMELFDQIKRLDSVPLNQERILRWLKKHHNGSIWLLSTRTDGTLATLMHLSTKTVISTFTVTTVARLPRIFGSSDYEYHLTIKAEDKDMILLLVLKALHDNPDSISSRVMDLARENNIRYDFHSF
jgi:hypothetical protein